MEWRSAQARWSMAGAMALSAAGCAAVPTPQAPQPAPPPVVVAPPPAPVAVAPTLPWTDRALDAGGWRYDANSRTARFMPARGGAALATLTCAGGAMHLTAALGAAGQSFDVSLKTSAGTDQLRFDGGGATLPARDIRLDRIAFSRGRFALEAASGHALTLPVQSEIGRAIEDCRG